MKKEFPQLEVREDQKEFLADWWSPRKLVKGRRGSGKTALMISEARRFSESGFDILFLSPTRKTLRNIKDQYQNRFGEMPTFDLKTFHDLEKHKLRGMRYDVMILDEIQETAFNNISHELEPMDPMFYRASACKGKYHDVHYLNKEQGSGFFDSVYEI